MSGTHNYRVGVAGAFVERLQARGIVGFPLDTFLSETRLSQSAGMAQLRRLAPEVVPLYPRALYYLIVSPEHRAIGAPPIQWWIDGFFAAQREPYYLALTTAAAHHGAQHQAPQVTQIITERSRRPVRIGRMKIAFIGKKTVSQTPTTRVGGSWAPFRVSTPAATVFDLVRYPEHTGGIIRAAELIAALKPKLTVAGFRHALSAPLETALLQRTGFLLEALDIKPQSRLVAAALRDRRLKPVALEIGSPVDSKPPNSWSVQGILPAAIDL